jgi:hypothetical protein
MESQDLPYFLLGIYPKELKLGRKIQASLFPVHCIADHSSQTGDEWGFHHDRWMEYYSTQKGEHCIIFLLFAI